MHPAYHGIRTPTEQQLRRFGGFICMRLDKRNLTDQLAKSELIAGVSRGRVCALMPAPTVTELAINTIRTLSIDAIETAQSGHPGLPLGAAPMAYVLWQRHLRHNPNDPGWNNRDRFVLSAGHGSMLLYSLLHLAGYDLSLQDLRSFRCLGSKTPGHPESFVTQAVEATTGPLGQGAANAVGMAIAEVFLAARFNRPDFPVVDHYTYALVSDGDVMEGVAAEAASLAGHLGLGKLIYLYDANEVTLDGPTSLTFSREDVAARYESYGWQILRVHNGDMDLKSIDEAIQAAKADSSRPSLILVKTTIGFGSPGKAGTCGAHGAPLGEQEVAKTKAALGWPAEEPFHVPDEVRQEFAASAQRGSALQRQWEEMMTLYSQQHAADAAAFDQWKTGSLPKGWRDALPNWDIGDSLATRSAAGKVLNAIAARVPWLLGGDADLGGSTKTILADTGNFSIENRSARNLRFGVREHAMGAICNGVQYHGMLRTFCATFFVFSDYMRPAVRLAALNKLPVTYVWTHDSIGLGEDGPTHQPVEHLMSLRAMPNLVVIRPADANETAAAWAIAMQRTDGPTALVLSRQNVPVVTSVSTSHEGVARGAYVQSEAQGKLRAILIATGSEVSLALQAQDTLHEGGIGTRVVSMPSWELFSAQEQSYQQTVLPDAILARVSVEAGVSLGWQQWIGREGIAVGMDEFGASAPGSVLMEHYGFTPTRVVEAVRSLVK